MSDWRSWLPTVWALALAVLLLGPALGPGLVLTYDMVWVPDLAVRPDVWGVGTALPRAVPSDAVVAVLDELVPGSVLQDVVLLGALVGGGAGAARLGPAGRSRSALLGRLVAVSVYQWNPFVTERLLLGHWPVLVGYGVLPWILLLARRWRSEGRLPPALLVLVPLGCLSASAGVATAVALLAGAAGPARTARAVGLAVAGNAPWLVTGLLHAADARGDAAGAGAGAFALGPDGALPPPLAALALGGVWNVEVVLPSREGVLAWLGLALLVVLAAVGHRAWWRSVARRDAVPLLLCWAVGFLVALATWAAPALVGWLATHAPGGGLLRDGARLLLLCAPLVAAVVGHGAAVTLRRVRGVVPRAALGAVAVVLPVTLLPDAALGLGGRLEPTGYPESYAAAREVVASAGPGDVLVLPLSSYRQPAWNGGRKVLDPLGRYLGRDFVSSDELVVSGRTVAGEDPRVVAAAGALDAGTPVARAEQLAALGIGLVALDRTAPGEAPGVAGRELLRTDDLLVVELEQVVRVRAVPAVWTVAAVLAWGLWIACLVAGPCLAAAGRRRVRAAP
ncbi:hypothetical protein [Nocardioides sp. SYSU DS0663]|uniref:hypothetical protein n=1 Tax=Nocardioides sp. SYSU DS0663 TaxID=3416445 RepID=UPI003F4B477F